ncbi:MAG: hypothetical protein Q8N10_00165 [Phenylobacterium sp.]|uniref:hypothetical protein n=1 Tax=Phenylobacterium sp. TaxID=1871053 RepID=UPI00271CB325|nr:hypothetical protein [Phenylobacterium sp.]MDO8911431.1 hypothetical protein [Phenylobacterium sp.]MDP3098891.1 hypothetical protein [Phenylobacterium sp.]
MLAPHPAFDAPPVRLIARTVLHHTFLAEMAWRGVFEGHHLSMLMWLSTDLANTEHLFEQQDLTSLVREGRLADERRRPITVRALGATLGLDAETTRRWTNRLAERGLCERVDDGLIVRSAAYEREDIAQAAAASLEVLSSLFRDFARWNIAFHERSEVIERRPWESDHANPSFVRHLFVVLYLKFILRFGVETRAIFDNDTMTSSVFLCVFNANNRPFFEDDELNLRYASWETLVPAELREPISIRAVAKRMGYPDETIRRHANRLIEKGFLEKLGAGYVVPTNAMAAPGLIKGMTDVNASIMMMVRLMDRVATALAAD